MAGYRTWQQLGRHVRRGERALAILAPVTAKVTPERGEDEERRVVGFRVVHVFDLAQTEGKPLPEVAVVLVEGDLPVHWVRIGELITGSGFALAVADLDRLGDANGITDWQQRDVVVRASLPGAQQFKTAVHELAHIRLHQPTSEERPNCRGIIEVEAESVAYMVCAALGIDSAGYSLPYVASWSGGDLAKVAATANRIIGCARQMLTQLEHERHLAHDPIHAERTPRLETQSREVPNPTPNLDSSHPHDAEVALAAATSLYHGHLRDEIGAPALEFLYQRGFGDETISRWQLGFAPPSWDTLPNTLRREGFTEELLLESGVLGRARTGRLYDLMRGRVVFPILDENGGPRGFAGRLVGGDGPKYLNTPETSRYKKRSLIYGMHLARQHIIDTGEAVIVEGYTDAIAAHQAGFTNVVATGGTALTPEHLGILRRVTTNVTLAFDGDEAGLLAARRASELERAGHGVHFRVALLPAGLDPADLLADGRRDLLRMILASAVPLEHHLLDQMVASHDLYEPEAVVRILRAAGAVIAPIIDPTDRARAVAHLAKRIGQDEVLVDDAVNRYSSQLGRRRTEPGRSLA